MKTTLEFNLDNEHDSEIYNVYQEAYINKCRVDKLHEYLGMKYIELKLNNKITELNIINEIKELIK